MSAPSASTFADLGVRVSNLARRALAFLVLLAVSACSVLSDSGPARRDVEAKASVSLARSTASSILRYALVDINASVLDALDDPGPGSLYETFGEGRGPPPELKVGIGDTVQVTLFEAQSGGLFVPTDAGARPGNFVTLPNQTVDANGYITVPYAGQVRVLNRGTPAIQKEIVNKLANRAIEPQALVALVSQTSTQVTVVGDVNLPNKFTINPAGDRVLDTISRAGGVRNPGYEEFVTLQRRGRRSSVYFLSLLKNSRENVYVQPNDIIYVQDNPRYFMAFGATGISGQFKFGQEYVSLAEAVGKAGGLLDGRAEPGQVFVYRMERQRALKRIGVDPSELGTGREAAPVIFRVNFRDPTGFFAARKFPMRDGDVVYVDNADQVEVTKFLSLLTTISGGASVMTGDAAATKGSLMYLQNKCQNISIC